MIDTTTSRRSPGPRADLSLENCQGQRQPDANGAASALLAGDLNVAAEIVMLRRTTSMPTPRPETSLTDSPSRSPQKDQIVDLLSLRTASSASRCRSRALRGSWCSRDPHHRP